MSSKRALKKAPGGLEKRPSPLYLEVHYRSRSFSSPPRGDLAPLLSGFSRYLRFSNNCSRLGGVTSLGRVERREENPHNVKRISLRRGWPGEGTKVGKRTLALDPGSIETTKFPKKGGGFCLAKLVLRGPGSLSWIPCWLCFQNVGVWCGVRCSSGQFSPTRRKRKFQLPVAL